MLDIQSKSEFEAIQLCINKYCNDDKIVFIEVGAYDGKNSIGFYNMCKSKNTNVQFYSFEADPDRFNKIYKHANIQYINKAVSNTNEKIKFYQSKGKEGNNPNEYDCCGSALKPKDVLNVHPFLKFNETQVEAIRLDCFCFENNIEKIDFLFADIQGGESNMIDGLANLVENTKFMFLEKMEYEGYKGQLVTQELIKKMESLNFAVLTEYPCDILFYNKELIK